MPKPFKNQNYADIKKTCLREGTLFDDPQFTADNRSLFRGKGETEIEWLRPKELCRVPKLVVEGISSYDLVYDDLSRAWFASACMALSKEPRLFNKVIPEIAKQEFNEKNPYAGIFKCSIWRYGEWEEVVVDDRLPAQEGKLMYCRSGSNNEFWSALLEKAYAKLHGDYESLLRGCTGDTLVDFTGGVCEKIDLKSVSYSDPVVKGALFKQLKDDFEEQALINCFIEVDPTLVGTDGPDGIVNGLGYIITMVLDVECKGTVKTKLKCNQLRLIRLFSPSTRGRKWAGRWAAKSEEMRRMNVLEWEKAGVKYDKEDEFWMEFKDFITIFTNIDNCHFMNTSFFTLRKSWSEAMLYSGWCSYNNRDGGGDWESNYVLCNPQFRFDVTAEKDWVTVSIEQKEISHNTQTGDADFHTIGFYIVKVEQNRRYRIHLKHELKYKSEFKKSRNSYGKTELEKGRYVVVACCEQRGVQSDFLLRLYTTTNSSTTELIKESPVMGCCRPKYKIVSNVEVVKADGIKKPLADAKGTLNPFVVIICEGTKITSEYQKNTGSPVFGTRATFYRKRPQNNIQIEVYNRNTVFNTFIGQGKITIPAKQDAIEGGEQGESVIVELFGKKKESTLKKPGKVHVFMRSSHDLSLL